MIVLVPFNQNDKIQQDNKCREGCIYLRVIPTSSKSALKRNISDKNHKNLENFEWP